MADLDPAERNESAASFMSLARSEGGGSEQPNGHAAPGVSSPSRLSQEFGRRLAVEDRNPAQPQVRGAES